MAWHGMQMRAHAAALKCDSIIGYTERVSIHEDVIVLSAMGTAAVLTPRHRATLLTHHPPAAITSQPNVTAAAASRQSVIIDRKESRTLEGTVTVGKEVAVAVAGGVSGGGGGMNATTGTVSNAANGAMPLPPPAPPPFANRSVSSGI